MLCLEGQIEVSQAEWGLHVDHSGQREQCINILHKRVCFFRGIKKEFNVIGTKRYL